MNLIIHRGPLGSLALAMGLYLTGLSKGKPKFVSASLTVLFLLAFLTSILGDMRSLWALLN